MAEPDDSAASVAPPKAGAQPVSLPRRRPPHVQAEPSESQAEYDPPPPEPLPPVEVDPEAEPDATPKSEGEPPAPEALPAVEVEPPEAEAEAVGQPAPATKAGAPGWQRVAVAKGGRHEVLTGIQATIPGTKFSGADLKVGHVVFFRTAGNVFSLDWNGVVEDVARAQALEGWIPEPGEDVPSSARELSGELSEFEVAVGDPLHTTLPDGSTPGSPVVEILHFDRQTMSLQEAQRQLIALGLVSTTVADYRLEMDDVWDSELSVLDFDGGDRNMAVIGEVIHWPGNRVDIGHAIFDGNVADSQFECAYIRLGRGSILQLTGDGELVGVTGKPGARVRTVGTLAEESQSEIVIGEPIRFETPDGTLMTSSPVTEVALVIKGTFGPDHELRKAAERLNRIMQDFQAQMAATLRSPVAEMSLTSRLISRH